MTTDFPAEGPIDQFKLVGTVLDRKFRIEKLVAEGGFGIVYRGTHLTLEKSVAVKVLKTPPEFNEKARAQFIEKFALEGKTMARISHPNIVQVLDFGAAEMPSGEMAPWMVLEWVNGQTLEEMLLGRRGRGPVSPAEALATLRPVLEALAYAHDEGIAHRDIKPANMMVVQGKRGTTVRLMDFGIAKLMEDGESAGSGATRTRTTMNAFSPQYAAPEQISGTRTGPWTDVHAMALITTEMLVDHTPYEGDDMTALFGQILSPQRPTPARFGLDVGPLEPVLQQATALRPDERFHNAAEYLAAFEQAVTAGGGVVNTGSFPQALTSTGQGTGTLATATPTTLRGATTPARLVEGEGAKSRSGLMIGLAALLVVGGAGTAVALTRGVGSHAAAQPPRAAPPMPPVAPPVAPTPMAAPPAAPPVAPMPVVAPPVTPPIAAVPSTPPPVVAPAVGSNAPIAGPEPRHMPHTRNVRVPTTNTHPRQPIVPELE